MTNIEHYGLTNLKIKDYDFKVAHRIMVRIYYNAKHSEPILLRSIMVDTPEEAVNEKAKWLLEEYVSPHQIILDNDMFHSDDLWTRKHMKRGY